MTDSPDHDLIYRIDVEVTAPVNPTEVTDRVADAIHALFPGAEIEERDGQLVAHTHSLDRLRERLPEQRIVDSARDVFYQNRRGDTVAFDLKKQAATGGVVNFTVGNPAELGDLRVRIRVEEPTVEAFIDFLAPRTAEDDGR